MAEYRVTWTIDVDAESPEEAARVAEMCMLDPTRLGNIFEVTGEDNSFRFIELPADG